MVKQHIISSINVIRLTEVLKFFTYLYFIILYTYIHYEIIFEVMLTNKNVPVRKNE